MDDTLEVPLTRGSEGSDARGSRDLAAHPVEISIAQRAAPDLVLWSDELGVQRKLRTSSRKRVSATGAATACEPELLTIHITDNHTKSQGSRSSWRTSA